MGATSSAPLFVCLTYVLWKHPFLNQMLLVCLPAKTNFSRCCLKSKPSPMLTHLTSGAAMWTHRIPLFMDSDEQMFTQPNIKYRTPPPKTKAKAVMLQTSWKQLIKFHVGTGQSCLCVLPIGIKNCVCKAGCFRPAISEPGRQAQEDCHSWRPTWPA